MQTVIQPACRVGMCVQKNVAVTNNTVPVSEHESEGDSEDFE